MNHLSYLCLLFLAFVFVGCGGEETIDYSEKIVGEWQLKNTGDLQVAYKKRPFKLKDATMAFHSNGTIETRLLSTFDDQTWITQSGIWDMPINGKIVAIKSDDTPFDEPLSIYFRNEQTFEIEHNGFLYVFVKQS